MTEVKDNKLSVDEERLEKVRSTIRDVTEPKLSDITHADVAQLRKDPALLRVAEIAEIYTS